MFKNMYVVTVARAFGGDDRPADAFGYCIGVFAKKKTALEKIKTAVEDFLKELRASFDEDELPEFEKSLQVVDNFELGWNMQVDYEAPDGTLVELYYRAEECAVEV